MNNTLPRLTQPREPEMLEAVRGAGGFDPDVWHVMNERDNALIADEILSGSQSSAFVYSFTIAGTQVQGVSVIGARHLAAHYGGLRHRLVSATQKTGSLFTFTSYPAAGQPMNVTAAVIGELANEPDFYSALVEIADVKSGNSLQIERREARFESRRDGSQYERPHYATIAQSKAFRNGILAIIPQDIVQEWTAMMLKLKRGENIVGGVLQQKRGGVLRFAAQHAIPLQRHQIEALTLDQLSGLGDAAREGRLPAFANAARALGLAVEVHGAEPQQQEAEPPRRRGRPPGSGRQRQDERDDGHDPGPDGPVDEAEPPPPEPLPEAEPVDVGPQTARSVPRRGVSFEA